MNHASILVVDDDKMIVHFFKIVLEEMGYEVIEACKGIEALEVAKNREVDLAIVDYKLSDIMGDVLAEKLKELNEQTVIIIITGYSEIKEKILRDKLASDVILKPIKDEELVEIVGQALNGRTVATED